MRDMQPSIAFILESIGVTGPSIRKLREETRGFLMLHNQHDSEKMSRLDSRALEKFARDFLTLYGKQFFPSTGSTLLKWPEDEASLVDHIQRVMFRQKMSKYYKLKEKQAASQDTPTSTSNSDSDDSSPSKTVRKRLATEGAQAWSPGGVQEEFPTRIYPTRSNVQPGMPILPSIEDDGANPHNEYPVNKRLCLASSSQPRAWRAINSPSLAGSRNMASSSSQPAPTRRTNIVINIPDRTSINIPDRENEKSKEPVIPNSPDLSEHESAEQRNTQGRDERPNCQRPYSLTGLSVVDEFILENHLHLSHTPDEARPLQMILDVPQCEQTPPPSSSAPAEDVDIDTHSFAPDCARVFSGAQPEEEDSKAHVRLVSLSHDHTNLVDLTGPDVVEIQTGEDQFKIIHKTRGPRVLQKLLDVLMDEVRICRRNARQAPMGQPKRIWEIKTTYVEELLESIQKNDELWQGGCISDRAVAML